jgi:hypothetical protein
LDVGVEELSDEVESILSLESVAELEDLGIVGEGTDVDTTSSISFGNEEGSEGVGRVHEALDLLRG